MLPKTNPDRSVASPMQTNRKMKHDAAEGTSAPREAEAFDLNR